MRLTKMEKAAVAVLFASGGADPGFQAGAGV